MSSVLWSCGYQFRISDGPDRGRTFALDAIEVTVGRARHQGDRAPGWILLNDPRVSRIHVDLRWSEEKKTYILSHKSETNQTLLNNQLVPPNEDTELKVGDLVRLGDTELDLQQADFRFGGVDPMQASLMAHNTRNRGHHGNANIPALAAYDSKLDNEKSFSTRKAPRKAALTLRPNYQLEVLHGPDQGVVALITGMRIALGGPVADPDAPPPKDRNWDQEVSVRDDALPEFHLLLVWRELDNAFELSRRPGGPVRTVRLQRDTDGAMWNSELGETPVLIRDGDLIQCANNLYSLSIPHEDE